MFVMLFVPAESPARDRKRARAVRRGDRIRAPAVPLTRIVSVSAPPSIVFVPPRPSITSSPAPPLIVLLPVPPMSRSLPSLPFSVASAVRKSFP